MLKTVYPQTAPTAKTIVRYDRSKKTWLAVNGTVTSFGTGPDAKRSAMLAALQHDHPRLSRVVTDLARMYGNPLYLVDQLVKAAQLICSGKVYANGVVLSQTRERVSHTASFRGMPKTYHCDCEDFDNAPYLADMGSRMCKHSWALHLTYLTNVKLPKSESVPCDAGAPVDYNP